MNHDSWQGVVPGVGCQHSNWMIMIMMIIMILMKIIIIMEIRKIMGIKNKK